MNKKTIFIGALLLMIVSVGCASLPERSAKKEIEKKMVRENIEKQEYTLDIINVQPLSGRNIHISQEYYLRIKSDSVYSYLPYFGRAYSVPYGGGEGLVFNAEMKNYHVDFNKKGETKITFHAATSEGTYRFQIEIFTNGNCGIFVQPNNKQGINYTGQMSLNK